MVGTEEVVPGGIISQDLQDRAQDAARRDREDANEEGVATEEHVQSGAVQRSNGTETERGRVARLRREAYSTATSRIRDENREMFNRLMSEECEKRGVEWTPRLDDEGKALEMVRELLEKYPSLKGRVQAVVTEE
jgi:hypothetical protein